MKLYLRFLFCLLVLTWGSVAQATCGRLTDAMSLAQHNFAKGARPDVGSLNELGALIGDLRNETILNLLQSTGRGHDFGDLRNFLTQLTFITQNAAPEKIRLTDVFATDLAQAASIVRSACILPDGSIRPVAPETGAPLSSLGLSKDRIIGGRLKKLSPETQRMLDFQGNLGILSMVILGFFAVGILIFCLHFGIIAARIIYRGRRSCEIPASLNFIGNDVAGRITMIGIYGCRFAPPEGEDAKDLNFKFLTEGTYCQIKLHDSTMSARVMYDTKEVCSLWLTEPLTRAALRKALQQSIAPPHYDFVAMRNLRLWRGSFGMSTLPNS